MSKKLPIYFLREYFFWMLLFAFLRLVFLAANSDELGSISYGEILSTFYHALYLDNSFACYLIVLTFFLFGAAGFSGKNIFIRINRVYAATLTAVICAVSLTELEIYNEYGTKIGFRDVRHMTDLTEVFGSARTSFLIFSLLGLGAVAWLWIFIHRKMGLVKMPGTEKHTVTNLAFCLLAPFLLFLGIREEPTRSPSNRAMPIFRNTIF